MYFVALQLRNYRSYEDYSVQLSPSINIVVGPNASGKTNLLESILLVSHGASYRGRDVDLIRFDTPWTRVEAYSDEEIPRVVSITRRSDVAASKEISIDNIIVKRFGRQHRSPVTVFEPEHLRMVHGSPDVRRAYLDGILQHISQGYDSDLRHYRRALAQRNRLLKQASPPSKDELFVWDVKLSEYGTRIVQARRSLVEEINRKVAVIYSSLSGRNSDLKVVYVSPLSLDNYANAFLRQLANNFDVDRRRGFSGVGPHREDITFLLNGRNASLSASRGETRTIVLSLKLIELELIEKDSQSRPVLLLDDVFSELDAGRRRLLTEYLKDYQTVITTTDADAIIKHFIGEYNVIPTIS